MKKALTKKEVINMKAVNKALGNRERLKLQFLHDILDTLKSIERIMQQERQLNLRLTYAPEPSPLNLESKCSILPKKSDPGPIPEPIGLLRKISRRITG